MDQTHPFGDGYPIIASLPIHGKLDFDRRLNMRKILQCWANEANLVLNPSKTKYMLLSSSKLSSYHELNNIDIDLRVGNTSVYIRVSSAKLLGTPIDHNLKWEEISFLLSHSWNLKEIEEFQSSISY